jgi:GT2 family glycosyltransferase
MSRNRKSRVPHALTLEPLVCLVVLNWNQRDLTLDCLDSLAALDYPAERLQIIVVDNGSTDDSAQAIRTRFPEVVVLETGENLGFASGNNVGIHYALQSDADYIMLLNNDTVVAPDVLRHLISVAEADPGIGIVTPKIYYYDEPTRIWYAGAGIDWRDGATRGLRAEEIDGSAPESVQDVDYASGCAICVRRSVIDQIGLLDPRFFLCYEETDWCVRAQAAGWRTLYVPNARLWHKVSATMGRTSPATDYYMNRNVLLFLAKNQRGLARLGALGLAVGRQLLVVAAYTLKPHGGQRLPHRDARLLALRDAVVRRWGKMGPDVTAVCYSADSKYQL